MAEENVVVDGVGRRWGQIGRGLWAVVRTLAFFLNEAEAMRGL